MQKFYIGWHQPVNGNSGCSQFERCIISVNRLLARRSPFPVNEWIMDSGAFTRITTGIGHLPIEVYAAEIKRWANNGNLVAAVTQDWMCESFVLQITGLCVAEHQRLTIENYDALTTLVDMPLIMPVLQGYEPSEYVSHLSQYGDRLKLGHWVGVGSVCKRNSSPSSIEEVLIAIKAIRPDLRLHGFGIKSKSLQSSICWDLLYSADSQAHGLKGGKGSHKYCGANDPKVALAYANTIIKPLQSSIFAS